MKPSHKKIKETDKITTDFIGHPIAYKAAQILVKKKTPLEEIIKLRPDSPTRTVVVIKKKK